MKTFLAITIGALINRLRGWQPSKEAGHPFWVEWLAIMGSKYACAATFGILVWVYSFDPGVGLIAGLGYALWAGPGWGDYWDYSEAANDEVSIIDAIVGIYAKPGAWADFFAMSLRGLIGYPLFMVLAAYLGSIWPLLIGLGMAAQGVIYHVGFQWGKRFIEWTWAFVITELLMGAWIGALVAAALAAAGVV